MTVIEIRNQIISHLLQEDTFSFADHLDAIKTDKEENREDLVLAILIDLEKGGLVMGSGSIEDESLCFTLVAPMGNNEQQVVVSATTANLVADVVNRYRQALSIKVGVCDKLNLHEIDILNLCQIIGHLTQGVDKG